MLTAVFGAVLALIGIVSIVASIYFQIVGIIAAFKKAWYIGLVAVVVPLFAVIVGIAKEVFETDILNA